MKPRHFWWLAATMKPKKSGPSLTRDEVAELQSLVAAADRGEF